MSQETTFTTLQQTVNLIGGLCGMAAMARFGLGFGLGFGWGSLAQSVAKLGGALSVDGRDLSWVNDSISGLKLAGLPHDTTPKQRSGKCRFRFSVLTLD
ncbi:MAG: hypothetical protein HC781_13830 [Leptolyngbyaceae cyanobacterium CSU_1_4]|nr:hypothetical protein [Leptolyngbyaceae cyanobacterium CSU_1_4]